jgi:hypothetical protein
MAIKFLSDEMGLLSTDGWSTILPVIVTPKKEDRATVKKKLAQNSFSFAYLVHFYS